MNQYFFFGSEDSQDYDVLVVVDDIPQNIDAAHNICKQSNDQLSEKYPDKPLNCNLIVLEGGVVTKVFKGTPDEVHNALFYTYDLHAQEFDLPIYSPVQRDLNEKILRVARFILSFFSRTHLRIEIKEALRGSLQQRMEALEKIDFVNMQDFPGKKEKKEDIYKVIAFQFGQVFSLIDYGVDAHSYTKSDIKINFPNLGKLIDRKKVSNIDLMFLNLFLSDFIQYIKKSPELRQYENI